MSRIIPRESGSPPGGPDRVGLYTFAAWVVAAMSFLVFVLLAWRVRAEPLPFDARWLAALRSAEDPAEPLGPGWLQEAVRDFTALGSHGVLVTVGLAAVVFLLLCRRRPQAVVLAVALASGILVNHLLKLVFARPRPEVVDHLTTVYTPSFPSGHAMLSTLVYLALAMALARGHPNPAVPRLAYGFAALLAVLVGSSRVYLGVHWPTDVIAGWSFGLGWALLCWQFDTWLRLRPGVGQD